MNHPANLATGNAIDRNRAHVTAKLRGLESPVRLQNGETITYLVLGKQHRLTIKYKYGKNDPCMKMQTYISLQLGKKQLLTKQPSVFERLAGENQYQCIFDLDSNAPGCLPSSYHRVGRHGDVWIISWNSNEEVTVYLRPNFLSSQLFNEQNSEISSDPLSCQNRTSMGKQIPCIIQLVAKSVVIQNRQEPDSSPPLVFCSYCNILVFTAEAAEAVYQKELSFLSVHESKFQSLNDVLVKKLEISMRVKNPQNTEKPEVDDLDSMDLSLQPPETIQEDVYSDIEFQFTNEIAGKEKCKTCFKTTNENGNLSQNSTELDSQQHTITGNMDILDEQQHFINKSNLKISDLKNLKLLHNEGIVAKYVPDIVKGEKSLSKQHGQLLKDIRKRNLKLNLSDCMISGKRQRHKKLHKKHINDQRLRAVDIRFTNITNNYARDLKQNNAGLFNSYNCDNPEPSQYNTAVLLHKKPCFFHPTSMETVKETVSRMKKDELRSWLISRGFDRYTSHFQHLDGSQFLALSEYDIFQVFSFQDYINLEHFLNMRTPKPRKIFVRFVKLPNNLSASSDWFQIQLCTCTGEELIGKICQQLGISPSHILNSIVEASRTCVTHLLQDCDVLSLSSGAHLRISIEEGKDQNTEYIVTISEESVSDPTLLHLHGDS